MRRTILPLFGLFLLILVALFVVFRLSVMRALDRFAAYAELELPVAQL